MSYANGDIAYRIGRLSLWRGAVFREDSTPLLNLDILGRKSRLRRHGLHLSPSADS